MDQKPSLIQISKDIEQKTSQISELFENQEPIPPELEDALSKSLMESEEKVAGYCLVMSRLKHEIEWMKEEIRKASEYAKRKEQHLERLEFLAKQAMFLQNITRLEGAGGHRITLRKSKRTQIDDETQVPLKYMRQKWEPIKSEIKKALESGEPIAGCSIIENLSVQWK